MQTKDVLKTVAIADITVSATNPRKHFDEDALKELSKSVAQYGVMTPILLRPLGSGYELVCGERRYRASVMAGKTQIPANIRDLSDDEAFELQIIENLERKEVHPLDEAEAFRRMLDCGRYNLSDISAKLAKPETFVVQRLKLNDLIEEIKKDFFNGELNISQAVLVARMETDVQQELLQGYKDKKAPGYGSTKQLEKEINNISIALDTATFSIGQCYGELNPCHICHKRTGNNPVMFPDMQEVDSCMDKKCFRLKTEAELIRKIEDLYNSGKKIYLGKYYSGEPSDAVKALATEYDLKILKEYDDYTTYSNDGSQIEILYVNGSKIGTTQKVWLKGKRANAAGGNAAQPGSQTYSEIQRIKDRQKRDLELDDEKVHARIIEALENVFKVTKEQTFELEDSFIEGMFLYMAMLKSPLWTLVYELEKLGYPIEKNYQSLDKLVQDMLSYTPAQKKQILLLMLYRECRTSTSGIGVHGQIIRHLANAHPDIDVDAIQKHQDEVAAVRIAKKNEKIAELEKAQGINNKTKKK